MVCMARVIDYWTSRKAYLCEEIDFISDANYNSSAVVVKMWFLEEYGGSIWTQWESVVMISNVCHNKEKKEPKAYFSNTGKIWSTKMPEDVILELCCCHFLKFLYYVVVSIFFFQVMFFKWPSIIGGYWGMEYRDYTFATYSHKTESIILYVFVFVVEHKIMGFVPLQILFGILNTPSVKFD